MVYLQRNEYNILYSIGILLFYGFVRTDKRDFPDKKYLVNVFQFVNYRFGYIILSLVIIIIIFGNFIVIFSRRCCMVDVVVGVVVVVVVVVVIVVVVFLSRFFVYFDL